MNREEQKNYCKEAIRKAGQKLLKAGNVKQDEKTDYKNLVTQYDKATQEYLMGELIKAYPNATFICEEDDVNDASGEYVVIIDPIDGTANFTKGYRMSAISVALAKGGKLEWGMVYNPYNEEFFEAEAGKGAYLNGKNIHVSDDDLQHSLVAFGTSPYYAQLKRKSFEIAEDVMDHAMDIRRSGSAALDLCYVACGRNGVYFELLLSAWDYAAGMLIVQEAGGNVTDANGKKPDFTKKSGIFSGNATAQKEFLCMYKIQG